MRYSQQAKVCRVVPETHPKRFRLWLNILKFLSQEASAVNCQTASPRMWCQIAVMRKWDLNWNCTHMCISWIEYFSVQPDLLNCWLSCSRWPHTCQIRGVSPTSYLEGAACQFGFSLFVFEFFIGSHVKVTGEWGGPFLPKGHKCWSS